MAEVTNDVDMKTSTNESQKRVFDDITNAKKKTKKTKKKKPTKDPPKIYKLNWTEAERATKEAPSNAMVLSSARRQPYGVVTPIQETHAPKIKSSAAFRVHEGADVLAAVKARKSGAAPSAPAGRLEQDPLWGGIAHADNAPAPPANIVGVHEEYAASGALGNEVRERKKEARGHGTRVKGVTYAPSFQLWRADKEAQDASPWYTDTKKAVDDCKRRWPTVDKKHPDYETTKMTQKLALALTGRSPRSVCASRGEAKNLEKTVADTKWKLAWK